MIYNKIYELFRRSPTPIRKLINFVPIKYRLGGDDFADTYSFLKKSEYWDYDKLRQYQRHKLDDILTHAVHNVPYYSNLGLPHENPFNNLRKFPIVDKESIQENKDELYADNIEKSQTYKVTTGGTSGNPLRFRLDNATYGIEWAFIMTGWARVGYTPGDAMVSFRGVDFTDTDKEVYWQYNPFYNTFEMSPFHMNQETLPRYVEKIRDVEPDFIHGYPSAISTLANYVQEAVDDFPRIEAVLAASENIYDHQRREISSAFNTRVFSHYGLSEKVVLAAECEHSSNYHLYPQYGVTEIVDEAGNQVSLGEKGEIVGTGFMNYCMPFIRYRTGDYGRLVKRDCKCGRDYLMIDDIQGKDEKEEAIVKKDGGTFPIHALYHTMHGETLDNIYRVQFVQDTPGVLTILVVPGPDCTQNDLDSIRADVRSKCGGEIEPVIKTTKEVHLTESGKKELLIQKLDTNEYL